MSTAAPARGASPGLVDVHSHVLPGVDDGAPDGATALAMLRAAASGGTTTIVATSHQHPARYPNAGERLRRAHELLLELRAEAVSAGEYLPEVLLGAEVHLDADIAGDITRGEKLTLAGGPFLLLELPDRFPLPGVEELVFRLRLDGITPVLAHPERIGQFLRDESQVERLVDLGCLVQVTGTSVAGGFGEPCRAATFSLLRRGLVHAVASDTHDLRKRNPRLDAARAAVDAALGPAAGRLLFEENPRALIEGRETRSLPPAPAPDPRRRFGLSALRSLLRGGRPGAPE